MKYFLPIMLAFAFFGNADAQTTKTMYTCPMHPEVQQAAPGKCPKCGMDLVAKKITVKPPAKPIQKPNQSHLHQKQSLIKQLCPQ